MTTKQNDEAAMIDKQMDAFAGGIPKVDFMTLIRNEEPWWQRPTGQHERPWWVRVR